MRSAACFSSACRGEAAKEASMTKVKGDIRLETAEALGGYTYSYIAPACGKRDLTHWQPTLVFYRASNKLPDAIPARVWARTARLTVLALASHPALGRSEDLNGRKIALIACGIAREQRQVSDGGVCADVEIRQGRGPRSPASSVSQEALSRQETGFPWKWFPPVQSRGKSRVQRFDCGVANRHFSVDDGIDDERGVLSGFGERARGPIPPEGIVGGDVQQDVAVHEHAPAGAQAGLQIEDSQCHLRRVAARVSPRVSARISSVLMRVAAVPRRASRASGPRTLSPGGRRALRMRA